MQVEFQTPDLVRNGIGVEKKGEAPDLKQASAWVVHFGGLLTAQLRVALGHQKESAPGSILVVVKKSDGVDTKGVVLDIDVETSGTPETDWKFQAVNPPPVQLTPLIEKFGGRILNQVA